MKLTLNLEIDEVNSADAELNLSDEQMKDEKQAETLEYLNITWTAIRNHYMRLKYGPKWYLKQRNDEVLSFVTLQ